MSAALSPLPFRMDYGRELEAEITRIVDYAQEHFPAGRDFAPRWLAIKLLESDPEVGTRVAALPNGDKLLRFAAERAAHLEKFYGDAVDLVIADRRYGFINGLVRQTLRTSSPDRWTLTDRIDDVVTHRWLGLPFFLAVMYVIFRLVIDVSAPFLNWVDAVINGPVARGAGALLTFANAPEWLRSLVIEGIIAGVGGVLVFLPGLLILYFFLAVLEDSGYLARAAFVMDRFMRLVGLHGKSFIPLVLGFGCAVPAIYATRTLSGRRDRILTGLLVPLMSCSARLPVYVVFGMAFFGSRAGTVIWALYALGIVAALFAGWLFTRTLLKPDSSSNFVLELPPYRRPTLQSLWIHMWEHARDFVQKAGTLILVVSVLMWLLLHLPWGVTDARDSYFGRVSGTVAPVLAPLGFGEWQAAGSLVTGFLAKEIVVSTLNQVYAGEQSATAEAEVAEEPLSVAQEVGSIFTGFGGAVVESGRLLVSLVPGVDLTDQSADVEEPSLSAALRAHFGTAAALAFLVFVLLYVPCVATLGAMRSEFGGRWAVTAAVYQTTLAWLAAFLTYQISVWWLA